MVEKGKEDEIKAEDEGIEEVRRNTNPRLEKGLIKVYLQETCTKTTYPSFFGKSVTLQMLMSAKILSPGKSVMTIEYMVSSARHR
jgi:hypothetical protein